MQEDPIDPRVARSRAKIFEAVLELLAEDGYARLTIEGVAARAGVGKTTIYRHWDSKIDLIAAAMADFKDDAPHPDTGNLRDDLLAILGHLVERFASGEPARLLPALISAAEVDPEVEQMHRQFVGDRRRALLGALEAAVERGELPADVDVPMAADLLSGPLFFRRFITREPVSIELVEQLVDTLLPRLGTICRPAGRGGGTHAGHGDGRRGGRHGNMRGVSEHRASNRRTKHRGD